MGGIPPSDALIHVIFDHYVEKKIVNCEEVRKDTIAHQIEQGNDYLFFKETFDITYLDADKLSTSELKKIIEWKELQISDKRIKQILVDQYGVKLGRDIIYETKKCRGYCGIKIKESIKKEFNESKCQCD